MKVLVVVDMLHDFVDEGGALVVPGASEIVSRVNERISAFEDGRVAVFRASDDPGTMTIYSREGHRGGAGQADHFATFGAHGVEGSWGDGFAAGLLRSRGSCVVVKGAGSGDGFSAVDGVFERVGGVIKRGDPTLRETLDHNRRQITEVEVVGVATEYCVRATVLDLLRLGFRVSVRTGCVAAVSDAAGSRALAEMAAAGAEVLA